MIKLYETNGNLYQFDAVVVECKQVKKGYAIALDQTAFFPGGGGQEADTGELSGQAVLGFLTENEMIYHIVAEEIPVNSKVTGVVDQNIRFPRMQNHSGEHIFSGLAHMHFGAENVGFHLGENAMTIDLDTELTAEQVYFLEDETNKIIWQNVPITVAIYSPEEASKHSYRSKKELNEPIRLVTVTQADCCACCAPHVAMTGEIGIFKITSFERYKGGTRLFAMCGEMALTYLRSRMIDLSECSSMLSSKINEVPKTLTHLLDEKAKLDYKATQMERALAQTLVEANPNTNVLFSEHLSMPGAIFAVQQALKTRPFFGAFFGNTKDGYRFAIGSEGLPLRIHTKTINEGIGGRGGGSDSLLQGSASKTEEEIRTFIDEWFKTVTEG